jgi:hypothetical protein
MPKFVFVIAFVAFGFTACTGTVPVFVTDIDIGDFSLPWYSPPNDLARQYTMQANKQELYINQAYMTSDGVTHIILKGTTDSGVPAGLLWSDEEVKGYSGGTYGYNMGTLGKYSGYGDFKVGTLGISTGGSLAIGSTDFSAEWVMKAPYTAVVIKGLVEYDAALSTITETNESLKLYSLTNRNALNIGDGNRLTTDYTAPYTDNPNYFRFSKDHLKGKDRGGYMILISKYAHPPTAMIEVNYRDGAKKTYNIDYGGVNFNDDKGLTAIDFQTPTPGGAYKINGPYPAYTIGSIEAGSISMVDGKLLSPLLLRPLYKPIKEKASTGDPRDNTTNMIHRIWFEITGFTPDTSSPLTYYSKDNFTLTWDDATQSITLYRKEKPAPLYNGDSVGITIHAELRKPWSGEGESTFTVTIEGTDPLPSP